MASKHSEEVARSRQKNNIVELRLHIPQTEKERIQGRAKELGKTVTGYIRDLIAEEMGEK